MKHQMTLLLVTLSLNCRLEAQLKTDTFFIQKDTAEGTAQSIYFDTDKKSAFYESISWFGMGYFDSAAYTFTPE